MARFRKGQQPCSTECPSTRFLFVMKRTLAVSRIDTALERASFRYREAPWKRMFRRAIHEFFVDDIPGVAAGATFYVLLAFFPAVVAFVSLYGLFADVRTAQEHLAYLRGFLPRDVLKF